MDTNDGGKIMANSTTLPPGFVIDEPANKSALPPGFAIDATKRDYAWGDVPGNAMVNTPASAGRFLGGIYEAVTSPVKTVGAVLDVGAGAVQNIMPKAVTDFVARIDPNPQAAQRAVQSADTVGRFYADRYGSGEGLKRTLAEDPVGVAADLSTVLTGGSMAAGRVPVAGSAAVAQGLRRAATLTNPLTPVAKAAPYIGKGVANVVGVGTGTGGALTQMYKQSRAGGLASEQAAAHMRGNAPMDEIITAARANLAKMNTAKQAEYRSGMVDIRNDKTVLGFGGIDNALIDAANITSFKGVVKNRSAANFVNEVRALVDDYKKLEPIEYHTPEGLDALKQQIGGVLELIPLEAKTARLAVGNIYNSVHSEITNQAPAYAKVMKDYEVAYRQIKEIERSLSVGPKATTDTAMRKLQSILRNNVNTNYGNRVSLVEQLEAAGGQPMMPALAGQQLNTWTPRGLQAATATGLAGLGAYSMNPMVVPIALSQSPRLTGEIARALGQGAGAYRKGSEYANMTPQQQRALLNALSRTNMEQNDGL
jgi:hypothetical protein